MRTKCLIEGHAFRIERVCTDVRDEVFGFLINLAKRAIIWIGWHLRRGSIFRDSPRMTFIGTVWCFCGDLLHWKPYTGLPPLDSKGLKNSRIFLLLENRQFMRPAERVTEARRKYWINCTLSTDPWKVLLSALMRASPVWGDRLTTIYVSQIQVFQGNMPIP